MLFKLHYLLVTIYYLHGTPGSAMLVGLFTIYYFQFTIGTLVVGSASGGVVYYLQFTIYNLRFAIGTSSCAMLVELFTIYSPPPSPTWNQARVALASFSSFGKTQHSLLCRSGFAG